jgi:hypothetical protein
MNSRTYKKQKQAAKLIKQWRVEDMSVKAKKQKQNKKPKTQRTKLSEPKAFTRPRAYYLDECYGRLRIIYPNGNTEVSGAIGAC